MKHIEAFTLAAMIDAWEHDAGALDESPHDAFRTAHPLEARYLWLLSRSFAPPKDIIARALANLIAWGLVTAEANVTPLAKRLLASAKKKLAPDPFASSHQGRGAHLR